LFQDCADSEDAIDQLTRKAGCFRLLALTIVKATARLSSLSLSGSLSPPRRSTRDGSSEASGPIMRQRRTAKLSRRRTS